MFSNILNEEDIDLVNDETFGKEDFQKSILVRETYDNIEEGKYPQEYENNSVIVSEDLIEKEINNDKTQAMFNENVTIKYPK